MAPFGRVSSRRRLVALVAGVVVLAAIVAYWVAASSQVTGMAGALPTTAERTIVSSTDVDYPDVGALTASSDLVVEGTIVRVVRGGTWRFAPDSGVPASGQIDRLLEIRVERTIHPSGGQAPATIRVLEGIWESGIGIQRAEMPWAQPGDRGIFFLVDYPEYDDDTTFNYVSASGRVVLTRDEAVLADHHHRAWQRAGLSGDPVTGAVDPAQARRAILDAAADVRSGAARAVVDPPAAPCPRTAVCPRFDPPGRG